MLFSKISKTVFKNGFYNQELNKNKFKETYKNNLTNLCLFSFFFASFHEPSFSQGKEFVFSPFYQFLINKINKDVTF